jgi:hypothetical protein
VGRALNQLTLLCDPFWWNAIEGSEHRVCDSVIDRLPPPARAFLAQDMAIHQTINRVCVVHDAISPT